MATAENERAYDGASDPQVGCAPVGAMVAFAAEHCWLTAGPILAAGTPA